MISSDHPWWPNHGLQRKNYWFPEFSGTQWSLWHIYEFPISFVVTPSTTPSVLLPTRILLCASKPSFRHQNRLRLQIPISSCRFSITMKKSLIVSGCATLQWLARGLINPSQFPTHIAIALLGLFGDVTSLAEPVVEFIGYGLPDCAGVGGGPFGSTTTKLIPGNCTNLEFNISFKLNPAESCEQGSPTTVFVFNSRECERFADVYYPTDENKDECHTLGGPISSAKFVCQDFAIVESELKAKWDFVMSCSVLV